MTKEPTNIFTDPEIGYDKWFLDEIAKSKVADISGFVKDKTKFKKYKFVRVIEVLAVDKDEALDKLRNDHNDFGGTLIDEYNFPLQKVSAPTKQNKEEWDTFNVMLTCKKCDGVIFGISEIDTPCSDHFKEGESE